MKCIFHVLFHGCPMLEFKSICELFKSLNVPNNLSMHGSEYASWTIVEFMHMQVQEIVIKVIQAT
jgi:hypothetical protein